MSRFTNAEFDQHVEVVMDRVAAMHPDDFSAQMAYYDKKIVELRADADLVLVWTRAKSLARNTLDALAASPGHQARTDLSPELKARVSGYRVAQGTITALQSLGFLVDKAPDDEMDRGGYTTWIVRAKDDNHTVEITVRLEDR